MKVLNASFVVFLLFVKAKFVLDGTDILSDWFNCVGYDLKSHREEMTDCFCSKVLHLSN